jgi:hypothetical protein
MRVDRVNPGTNVCEDIRGPSLYIGSEDFHLNALRHPAASASSGVQNHRLPSPLFILILA